MLRFTSFQMAIMQCDILRYRLCAIECGRPSTLSSVAASVVLLLPHAHPLKLLTHTLMPATRTFYYLLCVLTIYECMLLNYYS
jgi:hypothetical protein